ncbi:MAG TPA: hypothetical protein VN787_00760 [Steroidobacteraceae bacterium]|nr:hypothetical protein [Steroidobacteraceae bacterium]
MKRLLVTIFLMQLALPAAAIGRFTDVSVIDRDSGRALDTYYYRGEYWIAGAPGARYAIAVRNRTGERLLAVMAVDGVNVVSGETAGWNQTGYVFGPNQTYEITGWRKSNAEVAAFEFTSAPNSYADRTGRPANVGVIGVALFRERLPDASVALVAPPAPASMDGAAKAASAAGAGMPPAAREQAAPADSLARPAPLLPRQTLGTGHGEREESYVEHTDFRRRQSTPDEVIRIRYDSRDNLVALGVIRRPAWVSPAPNPFPGSSGQQFVPDPPAFSRGGLR